MLLPLQNSSLKTINLSEYNKFLVSFVPYIPYVTQTLKILQEYDPLIFNTLAAMNYPVDPDSNRQSARVHFRVNIPKINSAILVSRFDRGPGRCLIMFERFHILGLAVEWIIGGRGLLRVERVA